jgi:C1A family cysteine protease
MSETKRCYGWRPDLPDHRDYAYKMPRARKLPKNVDLRPRFVLPFDQGNLGSCTGEAIEGVLSFERHEAKPKTVFAGSPLFIYYNERAMEGTINVDAGAYIRNGIKSVVNTGVCSITLWPYNIQKFAAKPPKPCFDDAKKHKALSYARMDQELDMFRASLADGNPIVFGFSVYTAFESAQVAKTGILKMPGPKEKLLGGHAVVIVGYDDDLQCFIIRNSWGVKWGLKGYFLMPYKYVLDPDLADDFWSITSVAA